MKSESTELKGKFLEDLRSLTPLTFGPRGAPDYLNLQLFIPFNNLHYAFLEVSG